MPMLLKRLARQREGSKSPKIKIKNGNLASIFCGEIMIMDSEMWHAQMIRKTQGLVGWSTWILAWEILIP